MANPIFIDWVKAIVPCQHTPDQIPADRFIKVNQNGEIEYDTPGAHSVVGSFESSLRVRSHDGSQFISIDGNPTKYFQGHNITGSNNPHQLTLLAYEDIVKKLNLSPTDIDFQNVKNGNFRYNRLDITAMFDIDGTDRSVEEWIRQAQYTSRTRHGKPALTGGTLYWGKTSRRWAIKAYNKNKEMEKNQPSIELPPEIKDWVLGKLRIELVLRQSQLKDINADNAAIFKNDNTLIEKVYNEYLKKIELEDTGEIMNKSSFEIVNKLPNAVKSTYLAWDAGNDVALILSKATLYRHRKILRDEIGIDITNSKGNRLTTKSNVIQLVKILEARPATPPEIFNDFIVC